MGFESNFQATVLKYLNSLPGCKAENVSGNANQSGRPDINGCYYGRMFKIELKTPDNKNEATKKQSLELRKWKNAGCAVAVIYDMDLLKEMFSYNWFEYDQLQGSKIEDGCHSWYVIPPVPDYECGIPKFYGRRRRSV